MISARTKAALAAAKKRGKKLGGNRGVKPTEEMRARSAAFLQLRADAKVGAAEAGRRARRRSGAFRPGKILPSVRSALYSFGLLKWGIRRFGRVGGRADRRRARPYAPVTAHGPHARWHSRSPAPKPPSPTVRTACSAICRGAKHASLFDHQGQVLRTYIAEAATASDVALQLPTGSGKTLVGLLLAEWRRRKNHERTEYGRPA